jgi:hypothetical protein
MDKKSKSPKTLSLYGHKPEDVIRAFLKVDPKKLKKAESKEQKSP